MKRLLIAIALSILPVAFLVAQEADTSSVQEAGTAVEAAATEAGEGAAGSGPVPVPELSDKARRYYRSGNWLWLFNWLWRLGLPAILLFSGLSAKIRDVAQKTGRYWFFTIGIYFALFTLIVFVVELPLSYYQSFARPHAYDLSNQTLGKWFGDSLKGLMLSIASGFLLLWIPYGLLRLSPKRWWFYMGLLSVPLLVLFLLVSPLLIDPLFHEYGPLEDRALEAKVLGLTERAGVEGGDVHEVKLSVDTKSLAAWVTGFGDSKRVVLSDNIIDAMTEEELLFVVGHETGHYVLGHVPRSIAFLGAIFMLSLYVAHRFSRGLIARFKDRIGFDKLSDVASLPLILMLLYLGLFIITPVFMGYSRWQERQADRFGLEITQTSAPAARAFVKLQHTNLGNPRPGLLYKLWRSSHPTLAERIDFCNEYRPWETGEPLVYGDRFKP
jgi:Zn-dependent protease with chaperone function